MSSSEAIRERASGTDERNDESTATDTDSDRADAADRTTDSDRTTAADAADRTTDSDRADAADRTTAADGNPLVSVVIATYNRSGDLREAVESALAQRYSPREIVIVSNSDGEHAEREGELFGDDSSDAAPAEFRDESIRYVHFPERVGVPEARNVGFDHADGEYLVTFDDDAVLAHSDALDRVVEAFDEHQDVAALAFESQCYDSGELRPKEIPMPPGTDEPPSESIRVSSFCGVGNALRRDVVLDLDGYPDGFVYGFEEQDLSIRIRNAGYGLRYLPSVAVRHKESASGRLPSAETRSRRIENRIKIAVRNLPLRYVVCTALLWSVYGLLVANLSPGDLLSIYRRLFEQREELRSERSVVDSETVKYLKANSGMLSAWWYGPNPLVVLDEPRRLRW